ncbi:MAG: YkgJ family cysteine cluster protein [Polyangiales bacterium]
MARVIEHRYDDPLDLVWLDCARTIGLTIARSDEVYASFDGARTLTLSTAAHFDADDSLAQLVFHELCHGLVAGKRMRRQDWGMENVDARDLLQEHACHRLQAALADAHGLRGLFAVTTEHRVYWDALPIDPLGPGDDPAIPLARDAYERATEGPWAAPIAEALTRTAKLAAVMRTLALPADSLWRTTRALHASGFPEGDHAGARCGDCAWSHAAPGGVRCRQMRAGKRRALAASLRACVRFEPKLDEAACGACGACCREGFDRVELRARDVVKKRHPKLVAVDGFGAHLPRPDGSCVALTCSEPEAGYRCRIYDDRPRACADFAVGGDACLDARRRVGLSV